MKLDPGGVLRVMAYYIIGVSTRRSPTHAAAEWNSQMETATGN